MFEFVLYSRKGRTDGQFRNLLDGGRLDIVYQCILTSIFKSHGHRKDVIFHAFLHGSPRPPLHLEIYGNELYNVRLDESTWEKILRKVLEGGNHPGIKIRKESIQAFIKDRHDKKIPIFVLEERGKEVSDLELEDSAVFIVGDHIGLPKKDEKFVLRYGEKVSLGKQKYLAASCIDIINYLLDIQVLNKNNTKR